METIEIRFHDGEVDRPKMTWVSEPIHHGFFKYTVPTAHRRPGHEISAVLGLDAKGRIVADATWPGSKQEYQLPLDAIVSEREQRVSLQTRNGEAVVWEAPTRYEGRCAWLEHRGRIVRLVPCMPQGYDYGRLVTRFVPSERDLLFAGWATPALRRSRFLSPTASR